jgi:hypothetical protein
MHYLTKISGRFDELSKQALDNLPDGAYIIEKKKNKRTNPQNRYWRGVVVKKVTDYLRDLGNDVDEDDVHEILTKHYLPEIEIEINGRIYKRQKRISDCNTVEFSEVKDRVQMAFSHVDVIIPDPNQEDFLEKT